MRIIPVALVIVCVSTWSLAAEWADWEKYRTAVHHPALTIKDGDLQRMRENVQAHPWAKDYVEKVDASARSQVARLTPDYVARMIPETTPGDRLFTPCPACRDQGKPYVPHGVWEWDEKRPDELKCQQCGTIYPNDKYPETVQLHAKWGGGQTLTFYGGEPFKVFGYEHGRPSFTGTIRARKVIYMAEVCRTLGEAYALTGKVEYAQGVKKILTRLAVVYPKWMVHVGYGEYADMDPGVAAANIEHLPVDELVVPPNQPDRKLHTGFWTAGRATGSGLESYVLRRWTVAYDMTCEAKGVWSDEERKTVERDLLLEATKLATADPEINNKSISNRSAAAMVGMCVGEPGLVRFGLKGFEQTVDGWFLKDGGTPESFAYAVMAVNGVEDLALASRGYSDPAGYRDVDGKRLDRLNLYHGSVYGRVWAAMYNSLQGDLKFPPLADTQFGARLTERLAELMADFYPERPEYMALLRELSGPTMRGDPSLGIYYRAPTAGAGDLPKIVLKDVCLPELRIGFMRTGDDGRESLLTIDASHWGNHHHWDSLNLYYWKQGAELLGDFGYLWDNPDKHMTARTVAHNTVVIDGVDQLSKNRGGDVEFFATTPHVKAMRASSHAYAQASKYERTTVLVDHGGGRSYAVDIFHVDGGKTQDYVFHGTTTKYAFGAATATATPTKLYDFSNVRAIDAASVWKVSWDLGQGMTFDAWSLPQAGETAFVADGWGQRDSKNSDIGRTVPYVVRRCEGDGERTFVSVFEGYRKETRMVKSVALTAGGVIINRTDGGTDYVLSSPAGQTTLQVGDTTVPLVGKVAVVVTDGHNVETWFDQGKKENPG